MRGAMILALVVGLAAPVWADSPKAEANDPATVAPIYKVLKEDASIFSADRRVSDFYQGEDGSLILRAGVSQWYRVEIWQPCKSDLRWEHRIALKSSPTGSFDRFSGVFVDGRRCAVDRIDQIEDPRPVDKALRDKAKAAAVKS